MHAGLVERGAEGSGPLAAEEVDMSLDVEPQATARPARSKAALFIIA
jgi:hypothetical protein